MAKTYTLATFQNFTLSKWSCLKGEKNLPPSRCEMSILPYSPCSSFLALSFGCLCFLVGRCLFFWNAESH